ncbi:RTA1-domain-containing protein [Mollisia scopiformis]|uniref:RTA1-domain-containing protein n=1 Tax=Mollisia scopiformis TaxID=149040 RepID=A0A132BCL5_MOLSC|nr:RTA1-domain-containing protein [Mollisia scopiformis]KUJ10118.1 RTA1-domain-containing protein [Mollisia scopiformis]
MHPQINLLALRDHAPNFTIPAQQCTLNTCSIIQGQLQYDPSLAGNAFFLALFASLLSTHILLGTYYRTWTYSVGLVCGLILELCGYIGRVQMHFNPFIQSPFFMYVISLTIAPVFLCASIYVCFNRLIIIFGTQLARLKGRALVSLFIASDFLSLLLQTGGGAIAVIADTESFEYVGIHLMMAGLALQVASLVIVLALAADFALRYWKKCYEWDEKFETIREKKYFRGFVFGLLLATVTILIRSIFRVVELTGGFHGRLWNDEVAFMCLDGTMVATAYIFLTVFHPGLAFHGRWELVKRS